MHLINRQQFLFEPLRVVPVARRKYLKFTSTIPKLLQELPTELHNESGIVQRISEGDESAFEAWVTYYGPQVEKAIYQVVRTEMPVKDIMQDVFLNIWIGREKLGEVDNPRTWLFRIVYYRSYTWLRKQVIKNKVHQVILNHQAEDAGNPVEENSVFEETKKFIQESIDALPGQTRKIYRLSREENKSIGEIAAELNLSSQTVKNTLSNALRSIRKNLEEKGILLPAVIIGLTMH
jgi:RNA polymerase sigma-70 factor (family 1)